MFNSKIAIFALAGMGSIQAMAAPVTDTSEFHASQVSKRQSDGSVYSSEMDINFCMWQSGMFFVGWSVIMTQFGDQSVSDMYNSVDNALSANSACNSYTWMQTAGGIGAQNTTIALSFNTDDFCTADTMSGILNGVSGTNAFGCSGDPPAGGDPDISNIIAELLGESADEDPSDDDDFKKRSLPQSKPDSHSTTAHPQGLANLTEATTINGLNIPSVAEMAAKVGLPQTATRHEVIEKSNEAATKLHN